MNGSSQMKYKSSLLADKYSLYKKILFFIYYFFIALEVAFPNSLFEILILLSFVLLLFTEERYLTLPGLHIFQDFLYFPFVSIGLTKYAIILIMVFEIAFKKRVFVSKSRLFQLIVCFLYILFVLYPNKSLNALVYIPIIAYYAHIFCELKIDGDKFKSFCTYFVLSMIISLVIGIIQNRFHTEVAVIGNGAMELTRFFATFADPNYAGMFFNAAIFMCIILKIFNKYLRALVISFFYIGLIMTMSMTAIISNLLVFVIFYVTKYGITKKSIAFVAVFCLFLTSVYLYGLNSDIELLNSVCTRIHLKLEALIKEGDIASFLSGRSELIDAHWRYMLENATDWNWLFGGIPATALYCSPGIGGRVAHLEYVDLVLNIGVLGLLIYMGSMIARFCGNIKEYFISKNNGSLVRIVLFINYFICGFSLTLFMEPQAFIWILL